MRVLLVMAALLGVALAGTYYEGPYSFERDNSPMARLARDYMPHIRTREQLKQLEADMKANMNQYVDRLLGNAKSFFLENEMDPMPLPDYIRTFSKKILWITWHGELVVNNGRLQDLTTIFRSGDVTLDYQDKILLLDASIGFKDLQFGYDFSAKFMGIGPKGYISGRGDGVKIRFKIHVDLDKRVAGLDLFDIEDINQLTAHLNGLGVVLDWLFDTLADLVLIIFKGPIVDLIESEVGKVLGNVIAKLDIASFLPQIYYL
ncbi:uncharacterized protein LOC124161265 [Ischnura elegans]|uniref:uncharacterized protein LOC124161265 n=1 Tax=Ischnura elegans TaxID=197161 RepID=UPI001ED88990|nr:uncharacterized protein LOC124161265 [Ischnura elegans]